MTLIEASQEIAKQDINKNNTKTQGHKMFSWGGSDYEVVWQDAVIVKDDVKNPTIELWLYLVEIVNNCAENNLKYKIHEWDIPKIIASVFRVI